jgi:tripartite-type tricarboxylate transporter receptor subunit TctC
MEATMTRILGWLLLSLAAGMPAFSAAAQSYPSRPVKLIVPYPAGGNTDIVARLYSQKLSERIGQPVVIDNRGGAAGALGVGVAAKSPNDGYTLVVGDLGSLVIGPIGKPNVGYDPLTDLVPIAPIAGVSIVVTVNPNSPDRTFAEFLARARAHPGKLTYGTGGIGGPGHLAFEMLRSMSGVDILHVPFKGGAQAVTGLLGGQVDIVIDGTAMSHVSAGRLRALAVTGPRLPALPDVPGIGEVVKGFDFTNWWGILAPAGTPRDVVERLNRELTAIAALPEVQERLSALGLSARSSTPDAFQSHIRSETEKVRQVVQKAGIKFD